MAKQIQVTVVNIEGFPQKTAVSQAFETATIIVSNETVATSPTANSKIRYFYAPNQMREYYVEEEYADIVSAANTDGTSQVELTVYKINGYDQNAALDVSVPADGVSLQTVLNQTPVNTIVSFMNMTFAVSETEDDIVTAANAGGGGGGDVASVFGRTGAVTADAADYASFYVPLTATGDVSVNLDGNSLDIINGGAISINTTDATGEGSLSLNGNVGEVRASLYASNSTDYIAQFKLDEDDGDPYWSFNDGTDTGRVNLTTHGLENAADYSADLTARSLIDKGYGDGAYILVAGKAGGQTVIGGTAATDDLILQTTAGVGASGANMVFQGGNNGATQFAKVDNGGFWVFGLGDPNTTHRLKITQPSDATSYYGIRIFSNNGATYSDLGYGTLTFNGAGTVSTNSGSITLTPNSGNLLLSTGNMFIGGTTTPTALLHLAPSSTARASLNLGNAGTAPTSPNNGDMWIESNTIKVRLNGATVTVTTA